MTSCRIVAQVVCFLGCLLATHCTLSAEDGDSSFRGVLDLAGIGSGAFAKFSDTTDYQSEDWQLLIRLKHRLAQYSVAQQSVWTRPWTKSSEPLPGDLLEVVGVLESVETLSLPKLLAETHGLESLFRCRFYFGELVEGQPRKYGSLLSTQIPSGWQEKEAFEEPISFRGILIKPSEASSPEPVFFTSHVAWFPRQGVPPGHLLLARLGMDVALLDEVRHGRPFVKADVSREGEAFYGCLAAIKRTQAEELSSLAKQSVEQVADQWREKKPGDAKQRAIAAEVQTRSELGLSSVAPLFFHPEQMTGQLIQIEGTARRAVQIAVTEYPGLDFYYELEIFPPDSQNLPVVCCVNKLPAGFPTGDSIREPVRVAGLFFKGWLYRSRKVQTQGQTTRQRRMYTPVVIAGTPIWLGKAEDHGSIWGLLGGIVFLVVLLVVALNAARLAAKDRRARAARPTLDVTDIQ